MGKQLRFIITENKNQLLSKKIEKISQENDLIMYSILDKKIINDYIILEKTNDSIYLFEKNNLKYIHKHIDSGDIDGLYENGLEIDLGLSSKTEIYEYSRLWIDRSQYLEEKTTLYKVYEILVKFIKKHSLGYNKEATEWMFFEEDYVKIYKRFRKKLYDQAVRKSNLPDKNFKIIMENKETN